MDKANEEIDKTRVGRGDLEVVVDVVVDVVSDRARFSACL